MDTQKLLDEGFVPIDLGSSSSVIRTHAVHELFKMSLYEARLENGSSVWIKQRSAPDVQYHCAAHLDREHKKGHQLDIIIKRYLKSDHAKTAAGIGARLKDTDLPVVGDELLSKPFSEDAWHSAVNSIMFCRESQLRSQLNVFCQQVWRWHPHAKVLIFSDSEVIFSHSRVARIARDIADVRDEKPYLQGKVPQALEGWHPGNTCHCFHNLMQLCGLVTFPTVTSLSIERAGLHVCLTGAPLVQLKPTPYRPAWYELLKGRQSVGTFSYEFDWSRLTYQEGLRAYFRRAIWEREYGDMDVLLEWIARRVGPTLWHLLDFSKAISKSANAPGGNIVDITRPWNRFLSFDRIVQQSLAIQSAPPHKSCQREALQLIDLWADLFCDWTNTETKKADIFWQLWTNPDRAPSYIHRLVKHVPHPWSERLEGAATASYDRLREGVLKSIWATHRVNGDGIQVDDEGSIPIGVFTARVLKELRNTVHGYVNKRKNARRHIINTTGELPDEITFLPMLWLLLFLANPHEFMEAALAN